jgi:hypothetical protein
MNLSRWLATPVAAAAMIVSAGSARADNAQVQIQIPGQPVAGQAIGFGAGGVLLPPAAVEKLQLTAEQKEKFATIEVEFKDKQKAASDKLQETLKGGDRAKNQEAIQTFRTESAKSRDESLAKVESLLNDEQKKTLAQVKNAPPVQARPGAVLAPQWAPLQQVGGQVIPPTAQQKLKLTDEQKKKIDEMQKELENKILGVLTEEQKKQYEEMKKPAVQPNPGVRIQIQ